MRTYCINCYERIQRFNVAKDELKKNGFNNINWIRNKRNKIGGKGCFLSHLDCYRNFLKSNEDYCVIFEDDVKFINISKNNHKIIKQVIKNSPNYDIIFLGYREIKSLICSKNPRFLEGTFLQAHSYIINRYATNKIIEYYKNYKKWQHIDILFSILNLKTIALRQRICIQRQSKSDNQWIFNLESITNSSKYEKLQLLDPNIFEKIFWRIFIFIIRIKAFLKY